MGCAMMFWMVWLNQKLKIFIKRVKNYKGDTSLPLWRRVNHVTMAMFLMVTLWAGFSKIDIAVQGTGQTISHGENKLVQHLEGGILKEIFVTEGQSVQKGDILFKVSNSDHAAGMNKKQIELLGLKLQQHRIQAEMKEEEPDFTSYISENIPHLIEGEMKLFRSRMEKRVHEITTLTQQIEQKKRLLKQQKTQIYNLSQELSTMQKKMNIVLPLVHSGAASENRKLDVQATIDRLTTQINVIRGNRAVTQSEMAEVQSKLAEKKTNDKEMLLEESQDIALSIKQLQETLHADKDRVFREDITAPVSGTINRLYVNTVGGTVKPAEVIAELTPDHGSIIVTGKIDPRDRAKIWQGQDAKIQVSAFDHYNQKPITGKILDISADSLFDEATRKPYYRIKVQPDSQKTEAGYKIMPGMQTQIHVVSGKRTIMDYLFDPFLKVWDGAFMES